MTKCDGTATSEATMEALRARHSVRAYRDEPLSSDVLAALGDEVAACNREGGLHIQLIANEPEAFTGLMARYGKFSGVSNYFALVGEKASDLDERSGYYGERLAILAQELGLNTCWVAMSFSKGKCAAEVEPGEKLVLVIAVGYGAVQGKPRRSKPMESLCALNASTPAWFREGMEAAMLAPTAMNQQKFFVELVDADADVPVVRAKSTGGFYSKVDLGIVKYHFELGAGRRIAWAKA